MVKRKADSSLDEWLARGHEVSEVNPVATVPVGTELVQVESPAVAVVVDQAISEPVPVPTDNVASDEDEASAWFWALLEVAGYERW